MGVRKGNQMKRRALVKNVFLLSMAVLFFMQAFPLLLAQTQSAARGSPMYDPSTETTVSGIVEAVQEVSRGTGWHGVHLQLKTTSEVLDVHIGPSWFLERKHMQIVQGDHLQVSGSRLQLDNVDTLIARTIKKGDSELILRNTNGVPAWSRGRRF